jgi:hypothetical protein
MQRVSSKTGREPAGSVLAGGFSSPEEIEPSVPAMLRGRAFWIWLAIGTASVLILAAVLASVDGSARWLNGWLAYSLLGAFGMGLVFTTMRFTGAYQALPAALSALGLRLLVGVLLFLLFPSAGYPDNPATQAGYVFSDAYIRDEHSWLLAQSEDPLSLAFANKLPGDQYGGMMALSAWLYRFLSPDAHRPLLILLLTAAAAAAGVFFVWKAAAKWFGAGVAGLAAWIFALYPESVLLGSSQMREAFVLSGVAITFYSLTRMKSKRGDWVVWLAVAVLVLLLIQPPAALFSFVVLSGAWLLDPQRRRSWKHTLLFAGILLAAVGIVTSVLASLPSLEQANPTNVLFVWLSNNFTFKSGQAETESGIMQHLLRNIGDWSRLPVVLIYGIAQPVLPAALGDKPGVPFIWRAINIFRAIGWYSLAPFLVYGFFSALRAAQHERRWQLFWLSAITWLWIFIASANAGGNLWDNPRYRIMLLAWMAVLAAWAWHWARLNRDPWLWRLLVVEGIFVSLFTIWYIGRNYAQFLHIGIFPTIALTLLLSSLVLGWGWFQDRRARA